VKEDLEDYGSDSDSDSNFVSSTNTSDTDPDTDSDEDEDSFDDFEDVDNSGSGEHEQGLPHHFPATADTSTAWRIVWNIMLGDVGLRRKLIIECVL
jgi:hypothetical protein